MRIPNMATWVSAPDPDAPLVHWRHPWNGPTECGITSISAASTVSTWSVTCRDCLRELGVRVDDRSAAQKEADLAGALWRGLNP